MSRLKSYLFCLGIGIALAASTGTAHAQVVCGAPSGNTVKCTGGTSATANFAPTSCGTLAQPFPTHAADHYPTTINVNTAPGGATVTNVVVTIHNFSAAQDNVNGCWTGAAGMGLLLTSPNGRNLQIMRAPDEGDTIPGYTFDIKDSAGQDFPGFPSGCWVSACGTGSNAGAYRPSTSDASANSGNISPNYHNNSATTTGPTLANPDTATSGSATTIGNSTLNSTNGVFTGETANGNWSLYLASDDNGGNLGFTTWDITISYSNATTPSTTSFFPNPTTAYVPGSNGSNVGKDVILLAIVTTGATGSVTFKDGSTTLTCAEGPQPRPLIGGTPNNAVCTTTFSTEGIHGLSANYSGDSTYVASSGTANVFIQNHASNVGTTYCNAGAITNNGHSDAAYSNTAPYPSVIFVGDGVNTDLNNSVNTVSVTLKSLSVNQTQDLMMLLVAPDGTHTLDFWSRAGTSASSGDYNIVDGSPQLSANNALSPGTYGPTAYGINDTFLPGPPAPAPQVPGSFFRAAPSGSPNSKTFQTAFAGAGAHGAWSLFFFNGTGAGVVSNANGGWCLDISPATGFPTTVTVMANPTQAFTGASITFTANVGSSGHPTPNQGTVTFTENGAPLTGAPNGGVANVVNGVATIMTSGLPEGDHIITGAYHDNAGTYNDNFNTVTVRVDAHTATPTLNGSTWSYCNPTGILIPAGSVDVNDFGPAAPNPSNIFVTNLPGTISSVGVTLKQFHVTRPSALESLLVGPNGLSSPGTAQTLDFFSNAGGINAFGPQNTSFLDGFPAVSPTNPPGSQNAPTSLGGDTSYTASQFYTLPGVFQYPTTHGNFTFDTGTYVPNPSGSGGVYKNTLPNGTWSLYFDQMVHHTGDGASSWCANFTENPVTVTATKGHTGRPPNGNFQQGHPGASFAFNIKNNGDANGLGSTGDPDGLHPLKVVDVLDASAFTPGTLPTGTPWNCTAVTNTVTCKSSLAIASGSFYPVLVIPVNVLNNAPASATNQGSLSGGGITATTSTIEPVTIDPAPILAITKAHIGTFTQGQSATWTLQAANNSATAAGNTDGTTVTVTDTLPAGYTGWTGSGTNWTCVTNNLVVSCTSNDVINGNGGLFGLITLTGTVPAASPTSVSNSATVFGGGDVVHFNSGNAAVSNTDNVTVIQVPAFVNINGSATQSAPLNTAFGSLAVTVQDAGHVTIPNYMSVVFTAPASGASGTFDNATNTKSVTTGSGGSAGVADPGVFTANGIAGSYSMDVLAGTIHATFNLTNAAPDLTISKSHSGNFSQGQQGAQFSLVVTNGGGATTGANTITVTDTLPSGLTFASGTGTGWSCMANGQAVTCTDTATPIAASGTSTITLNVNVAANAPSSVSNTATVACTCTESNTNNNTSNTDMVTVTQLPDLTIAKSHSGNFIQGQQGAQFSLVVTNGGSGTTGANTITVTDTLPAGLTFASGTGTGWSCNAVGQVVTCTDTATPIAASGTSTITLNVNVAGNAAASVNNSATVACGCTELNTNNNTSNTDSVTIGPATVMVTVSTNINGPTVSVDGGAPFTGSQMFTWNIGSSHPLSTSSPQTNAGTQYVWLNWSDAGGITHNVTAAANTTSYTANFKTQFQLTTLVNPNATEGSISPATGFFDSGTMVPVTATANAGYAFTGFSGGLTGITNPQSITMNAAATVTANFAAGPTSLGGSFGTKTGPTGGQRVWTVNIGNNGPGVALGAKVTSFTVVQTSGTACGPTVLSAMPQAAGDIAPGGTMAAHVTIDFTGCFPNALFTVTANVSANSGAATGQIKRLNQLQ